MEHSNGKEHSQEHSDNDQVEISDQDSPLTLEDELQDAVRDRDQYQNSMQRAQADLINYRRRSEEEKSEAIKRANTRLLNQLLTTLDEFTMAFDQAPTDDSQQAWVEGFRLIHRKLIAVTESEGVTKIDAQDKPFHPAEHEALGQVESADHDDGQVIHVIRPGYRLHDKILRPAQVLVSTKPQSEIEETQSET